MPKRDNFVFIFEDNHHFTRDRAALLMLVFDHRSWIEFLRMAMSKKPYAAEMMLMPDDREPTPFKLVKLEHCNSEPSWDDPFGGTPQLPHALRE